MKTMDTSGANPVDLSPSERETRFEDVRNSFNNLVDGVAGSRLKLSEGLGQTLDSWKQASSEVLGAAEKSDINASGSTSFAESFSVTLESYEEKLRSEASNLKASSESDQKTIVSELLTKLDTASNQVEVEKARVELWNYVQSEWIGMGEVNGIQEVVQRAGGPDWGVSGLKSNLYSYENGLAETDSEAITSGRWREFKNGFELGCDQVAESIQGFNVMVETTENETDSLKTQAIASLEAYVELVQKKFAAEKSVEMPDDVKEQAKEAIEVAVSALYDARLKLKHAASRYLHNTNDYGGTAEVQNIDVGADTAIKSVKNGADYLRNQTSMPDAKAVVDSADKVENVTRELLTRMGELENFRTVDGPVDQLRAELMQHLEALAGMGKTEAARELIMQIEGRITEEKNKVREDAYITAGGVGVVSDEVGKETQKFHMKMGDVGSNSTTQAHEKALMMTTDTLRKRGEEYGRASGEAKEMLMRAVDLWKQWSAEYLADETEK